MVVRLLIIFISSSLLLGSCTVVNNLYINDPACIGRGKAEFYAGIGSGMTPEIDSVTVDGDVIFSDRLEQAVNLCLGGQLGLYDKLDLRFAMHLPRIVGGFGLRLGPQYSFFGEHSDFQLAMGADLGFVLAKDSIRIFGGGSDLSIHANGAINADFFMPMSIRIGKGCRLVVTPRYSLNTFFVRRNVDEKRSRHFTPEFPFLALGLKFGKLYLEASALHFDQQYFGNFGVVYQFGLGKEEIE